MTDAQIAEGLRDIDCKHGVFSHMVVSTRFGDLSPLTVLSLNMQHISASLYS
jgi:hypothetical protein